MELIAESYDKGIDYGRRGISLYDDLPEYITNNPDYIIYKKTTESIEPSVYSGYKEIREYLSPTTNMKFIDLGCCLNLMFNGYDQWASTYHGVDISSKTIELLNEFSTNNKLHIGALICGSIHETPFDANYFDIGACIGVLEYYKKDFVEKALIEAHRIIKPGGKLVLDIPNIVSPACRGMILLEEHAGRTDQFDMLPLDFENMLCNYFEIEKVEKANAWAMFQYFLSCKK
ncbi:TPA: class I SAM-dependent methyltransferase [Methanosarcina acetivorans]|uniref:Class I SAM-dependent methyltransferase n=1 Tax=Methanosarcina acetivorans TaxID=2214 RepID=A0A832SGL2_9EURY|nr:class I SAM-dependent methyltransferase [Methanosarcina acetivorans]HIH93010.1 class I SAM-dependent methyltransferase [Methanosarcina acetivorans]